jgi:hypothetical protein
MPLVRYRVERPPDPASENLETVAGRHLAECFPDFEKNFRMAAGSLWHAASARVKPGSGPL